MGGMIQSRIVLDLGLLGVHGMIHRGFGLLCMTCVGIGSWLLSALRVVLVPGMLSQGRRRDEGRCGEQE
jgi:hypothetical protein